MSIKLMAAAWELDIPSTEKMVLLCLCDYANDDGACWPSVATLCRKTSKSERTVQAALKSLGQMGFFEVHGYNGVTPKYVLDPRKICTPEEIAPPQKLHQTPAESAPKPSRTTNVLEEGKPSPKTTRKPALSKPDDVDQDVWDDFLKHRKAKKAPLTGTALAGIAKQADRAGWRMNDALAECVMRGWIGFKADWVKDDGNANRTGGNGGSGNPPRSRDGFVNAARKLAEAVGNRPREPDFGAMRSANPSSHPPP